MNLSELRNYVEEKMGGRTMIQILAVYSKAGSTWDTAIHLECEKRAILHTSNKEELFQRGYLSTKVFEDWFDSDCDIQILYRQKAEYIIAIWGFEAKATDLHASLIGNEVSFEDEVIQHLVRNESLTRYSAIVAGSQEQHDIQMFTGCCSKHGVNWNWCNTVESAVKKCFELVEHADQIIDCRKPIYTHKDKSVPTRARMLAAIDGITGDRALQLYEEYARSTEEWSDFFTKIIDMIDSNIDLFRIYRDFVYNNIEPQNNRLRDPHKKTTKRKEDH